jgi:hypothetical protein
MILLMKIRKRTLIILSVILIASLLGACETAPPILPVTVAAPILTSYPTLTPIPFATSKALSKKFLFVEVWVKVTGTGTVGSIRIDKPSYFFDSSELYIYRGKPLTSNDLGYIGQGTSMHGSAGGGIASTLTTMQQFPYQTSLTVSTGKMKNQYSVEFVSIPVNIISVSETGIIVVDIDKTETILAPGESWSLTMDTRVLSDRLDGSVEVISSVTNYGWLDFAAIHP